MRRGREERGEAAAPRVGGWGEGGPRRDTAGRGEWRSQRPITYELQRLGGTLRGRRRALHGGAGGGGGRAEDEDGDGRKVKRAGGR